MTTHNVATPTDLLVSLDGSDFAEQALGPSAALASALGASLHVVCVPEIYGIDMAWYADASIPGSAVAVPIADLMNEARAATKSYLADTEARLVESGLVVKTHVVEEEPGKAIIQTADEVGAWLIAMATHGRGGVTRWAFGSVADHVLRHARVPVLLTRSAEQARASIRHIVVPLDGSELAERILPEVEVLASALQARVTLVHVESDPDVLRLPAQVLNLGRRHAERMRVYLSGKVEALVAAGIDAVGAELSGGSTAQTLLDWEGSSDIDLVAMTTHGRTGLARAAFGSVADRILREGSAPVLVKRVV